MKFYAGTQEIAVSGTLVRAYVGFLQDAIDALKVEHARARTVSTRHGWLYIRIKKSKGKKGAGPVAVFENIGKTIVVLRIFHTSQDWQTKLKP